jgi:hypothetical protein
MCYGPSMTEYVIPVIAASGGWAAHYDGAVPLVPVIGWARGGVRHEAQESRRSGGRQPDGPYRDCSCRAECGVHQVLPQVVSRTCNGERAKTDRRSVAE